jgi:hypothetical protein
MRLEEGTDFDSPWALGFRLPGFFALERLLLLYRSAWIFIPKMHAKSSSRPLLSNNFMSLCCAMWLVRGGRHTHMQRSLRGGQSAVKHPMVVSAARGLIEALPVPRHGLPLQKRSGVGYVLHLRKERERERQVGREGTTDLLSERTGVSPRSFTLPPQSSKDDEAGCA